MFLDFEGYLPRAMKLSEDGKFYFVKIMCPPRKLNYFFFQQDGVTKFSYEEKRLRVPSDRKEAQTRLGLSDDILSAYEPEFVNYFDLDSLLQMAPSD